MKRCAIYTRKSTEEGLDQAFNSLDAQREACENYILSQKSEGWRAITTKYDDGGISGGHMERPALKALMGEIDDGNVDIIVVYKVDRLTRSLADFAKLVERFDKHEISFVSVTQQFNTSNSMGRLTLNVLLSFAQFEREVGAERVRDKIAASRKKGIWTGGNPPLGYDNVDKKLVLIEKEAEIVREIYAQYLEHGCVRSIIKHANEKGWVTKRRANGSGGKLLSRGPIYHMLKNPLYASLMKTGGKLYDGQHKAIVDRATWDAVQKKLANRTQWTGTPKSKISPLAGLLYWKEQRLTPDHTSRSGRRYRYYVSHKNDVSPDQRIRMKANDVEVAVLTALSKWLSLADAPNDLLADGASADEVNEIRHALSIQALSMKIDEKRIPSETWIHPIKRIVLDDRSLKITLIPRQLIARSDMSGALKDIAVVQSPLKIAKRGQEMRLMLGDSEVPRAPNETAFSLISRMHRWKERWFADSDNELKTILIDDGCTPTGYSREIRLAFLAPDIVDAFLSGAAPFEVTSEKLKRLKNLPADWNKQRAMLGIVGNSQNQPEVQAGIVSA